MKKVLFAIPTLDLGGAERVLVNLVNNLDRKKYNITVFTIFDGGINRKNLKDDINYHFFFKKPFRGYSHLLKLFSPEILYKYMIKENYDVVISYLEGPMTRIISGCPRNNKTKLLNWVHTEIHKKKDLVRFYRNFEELIVTYSRFDGTVFVSQTALNAFQQTFKEIKGPFLVKYNTIDTEMVIRQSKEEVKDVKFDSKTFNIISVGRFVELKGYIRLIEIIKLLINDKLNVHLYLIGSGELEEEYRKVISQNGLKENVTILGYKDNPYKYVRQCDLFVCSSYKEGYSSTVIESLLVGTPVITTLCSGMHELLGNNEYGMITENSKEGLYKGIKRILTEIGLLDRLKQKAIERGKMFSTADTVKAVEEILDN